MGRKGAVYVPPFEIENILDEDELADLLTIARRRVVESFISATEMARGRKRSTGNIIRADSRPTDLVRYITQECRAIADPRALPESLLPWTLTCGERLQTAIMVDHQLVSAAVSLLKEDHEIWYDEYGCYWSILVTQIDQYHEELRRARRIKKAYRHDRRNEHGQVRSQRKRRGRPSGASVSLYGPGSSFQAA